MASINIGQENSGDTFYRYKMPRLQAVIEGRGNGIKTRVVNNVEIAKALERPPDYIIKYFGCDLGAQTKYDKASGASIVNGAHDTAKLCELLESFIKKYVQCYSCGNPETVIKVKKDLISLKCKACGAVSDVDMRHKLNTYILKNPPEDKVSKAEKKLKKMEKERLQDAAGENLDKEAKKKKSKSKEEKEKSDKGEKKKSKKKWGDDSPADDEDEDEGNDDDDVVWMTDTSEAAAKARAEEQLSAAMASMVTQGNIEAEAEAQRRREEKRQAEEEAARKAAEEARKAAEKAARKAAEEAAAVEAARLEAEAADPVRRLRSFLNGKRSAKDTADVVRSLGVEGGLAGRMRVLYEAMLGCEENAKLGAIIKAHKTYLKLLGSDPASQLAQLVAFEHYLGVTAPNRVKEAAVALKTLYDADVMEEEVIVAWYDKASAGSILGVPAAAAKTVRDVAKPFVDWLREEEDESDEDEDED